MKYLIINSNAQVLHPVKWQYGLKKLSTDTYELHFKATIDKPWHIYSQKQPEDAIAPPTTFYFNKMPEVEFIAVPREVGNLVVWQDKSAGISQNEYENQVEFVQKIKIKSFGNTTITGHLSFQACSDHRCLQPEDVSFQIPVK